mmetsp:Transcript_2042/g.3708  ORF Transcript_2042/g.3708 Transcript_2042/m.3708 type:complete len:466 (-) Transcript_2042:1584-2981(-)|eukprot:CAMPEP_0176476770 /NCGR_PEP_ID=MMETSP0200_2-20121128/239_1 /TAXON_ID=947934 /ORGANISM="Chaetoceros sp., Strain GSL56" /LENGTH=465 /DNA_ID=CAMNT_0017872481 /DNA_START=266 /DNA_END=1663 /DNA_ORIENTATION=-
MNVMHSTVISFLLFFVVDIQANRNTLRCLDPTTVDYTKDYFPDKVQPKFSKHWDITYHKTYKILSNKFTGTSYALFQCGTVLPTDVAQRVTDTWSVPLQDGIAVTATTQLPQIEQLGLRRQVKGFLGDPQYVSSPCMNKLIEENILVAVNDDMLPSYAQTTNGIPKLQFLQENPEVAILRSSGAGNKTLNWSEFAEEGNIATYEWHKVMGALFNLEYLANEQFEESSSRYDCVSNNAELLLSESVEMSSKPTVLWAYKTWDGFWDVARCDDKYHYYCEYADACSSTLLHSNNGSVPVGSWEPDGFHMTLEEFVEYGKDADHWIIPSYINDLETDYADEWEQLSQFKSIQNGEVYDVQKSGGGPWFEQRLAEYDVVLQDFCEIVGLYDEQTSGRHERMYFRKVYPLADVEPIGSLGTCERSFVDLPWETRASTCELLRPSTSGSRVANSAMALSVAVTIVAFFTLM